MAKIPDQQEFERSLGFALSDVTRLMRRIFNQRVQDLDLTQTQWQAIAHIARNEGIRQRQLAEILEVRPISVARLIDRMEVAGWIKRTPDPNDRRAFNLHLTDKVAPILKKMQQHAKEITDHMLVGISSKDEQTMLKNLLIMRKNLCEDIQ